MALTIRMRQQGRRNRQTYRVVLTDERAPRDGKYLEQLGWYNPFENEQEKQFLLDASRIDFWLQKGAKISDNVKSLMMKSSPEVIKAATQRAVVLRAKNREKVKARRNSTQAQTKETATKAKAKKG